MIIISARLLVMMMSISGASNRSSRSLTPKRSRTAEAILVPKIEHLTASILKNPFTMSNTTGVPVNHHTLVRRTVSLHHLDMWLACRTREPVSRTPYSIRGLALWARFAALAGLGDVRCSFAAASRRLRLGGAYRDRTDDLMLAKQPLSQLS